jgi:hypothetical protein
MNSARSIDEGDDASALLDRTLFQPYLEPGEKILWAGRPSAVHFLPVEAKGKRLKSLGLAVLLLIPLAGLSVWKARSKHPSIPLSEALILGGIVAIATFGALFVFYGTVFLLMGRGRLRRLRQESYALTDRRALVLNRALSKVNSLAYDVTTPCQAFVRDDGSGRIVFGKEERRSGRIIEIGKKAIAMLAFDDIDNVALVHSLAKDAAGKRDD